MELHRTPWFESYPQDVPYTINPKLYDNLPALFDDCCQKYGNRKAFISLNCSVTYNEVYEKTCALATYLQKVLKAKKGDRLAVILPNVIQYPISVFAALKCGMQVVNINPLYTSHEILGVLRDSGARIVVCLESITSEVLKIHDQTYLDYIISCSVGDCLSPMKGAFVNFYLRHFTNMVPK